MSYDTYYDFSVRRDEDQARHEMERERAERHGGPPIPPLTDVLEFRIKELEGNVSMYKTALADEERRGDRLIGELQRVARSTRCYPDLAEEVHSFLAKLYKEADRG